jgi:hypothetical protein
MALYGALSSVSLLEYFPVPFQLNTEEVMRISEESDHWFRSKFTTDFGAK